MSDVAPDYLVACVDYLALVVEDPLVSGLLHTVHVVPVPIPDDAFHSLDHLFLHIHEPNFNIKSHTDRVDELDDLFLGTYHAIN